PKSLCRMGRREWYAARGMAATRWLFELVGSAGTVIGNGQQKGQWVEMDGQVTMSTDGSGVDDQLRLMAVHAHPDDESSKGAAAMAKYVADGVDVLVGTCTGGERGSVLNKKLDPPEGWANIPESRRERIGKH